MNNKTDKKSFTSVTYTLGNEQFDCPVKLASKAINGKWKLLILNLLSTKGVQRFSDLKKEIKTVSEKMLIQHLKQLAEDGLVERKVYPEVPPKVEYFLTNTGKQFIPVLEAMRKWGTSLKEKPGK